MRSRTCPELRRRGPVRDPIRYFFLYFEGQRTEPEYFKALERCLKSVHIRIQPEPAAGVPYTIAQKAVDRSKRIRTRSPRKPIDSFERQDEVWAIFDRDEHERYEEAIAMCEARGVGVARSNPCFELWLILHEQDYDKPDDRHCVQAHFCRLRPEYHPKNKVPDCSDLVDRVEIAEHRAQMQLARREAEGNAFGPPSTTVGKLTAAIRAAAEMSRPR